MSADPSDPIQEFNLPRLILCEGEGDKSFFRHLIEERQLPNFEIEYPRKPHTEVGGWSGYGQMLTALRTIRGFPRLRVIVVVADNDEDPDSSFHRVVEQIASAEGYAAPDRPLEVSRAENTPPLVVATLPWAGEPGTIETLCLRAAHDERQEIKKCLDAFVECTSVDAWPLTKQLKMRMRCMLAASCRADPNTSLVHAWSGEGRYRLIPLDHPCFDRISDFLREVDSYVERN